MKNWNGVLLESIIRDALFEQASSESDRVIIRPMLGTAGANTMTRAMDIMGVGPGRDESAVSFGFEVINRKSSSVSELDVVKAIINSSEYGKSSTYNTDDWVYLISNNRALLKNSSKRDVLILKRDNYNLQKQLNDISKPYNVVLKQMKSDAQREYAIKPLPTTATNTGMQTDIYFSDDIQAGKDYLAQLKTDQRTMTLSLQSSQAEPRYVNYNSKPLDILKLRSAIIEMMNNNTVTFDVKNEDIARIFTQFKKNIQVQKWDANMFDTVSMISSLYNALGILKTEYRGGAVDEPFYKIIEKYQTENIPNDETN
jgi:hypothetical protein